MDLLDGRKVKAIFQCCSKSIRPIPRKFLTRGEPDALQYGKHEQKVGKLVQMLRNDSKAFWHPILASFIIHVKLNFQNSNIVQNVRALRNKLGEVTRFKGVVRNGLLIAIADIDDEVIIEVSLDNRGQVWVF